MSTISLAPRSTSIKIKIVDSFSNPRSGFDKTRTIDRKFCQLANLDREISAEKTLSRSPRLKMDKRCSECSAEEVDKWMTCDSLERGFQILSDDEIQSTKELISDLKEDDDDDISIEL
ncbi:hypothetical protein CEXT_783321 [Caerostris extrusa]|uniref:Uncharacterized protein n=1 Tax=Caerostris extrusa TaxID=172846 RepID=A0AAV4QMD9_CAEEX|nr:hypothetical protein CEXT_783321 [Caerostris extrusa]